MHRGSLGSSVRWSIVLVGLAGALGAAALGAAAAKSAPFHPVAADPITGTWVFSSRRTDLSAEPQHTISASGDGFDIVANAGYKSGAPGGVTFSLLERASAFDDNPQCSVAPGTVVGHFRYASTDAKGIRHYEGQMLKGQVSSGCTIIGLGGPYYAKLVEWSDSNQNPPLADGPHNRLCISDSFDGCYVTFDRKGGTAAPTTPTAGGCRQWNVTGTWHVTQANGSHVVFRLKQTGTTVTGTAALPPAEARAAGYATGRVTGTVKGSQLVLKAVWAKTLAIGQYTGTVSKGVAKGSARDLKRPGNAAVAWSGRGPTKCVRSG